MPSWRMWFYSGLLGLMIPGAWADNGLDQALAETPFMLATDPDGIVNVRSSEHPAKVIGRIMTPQVVASYGENHNHGMYHDIQYASKSQPAHFQRFAALNPPGGLIHHSRLQPLNQLPQFTRVKAKPNQHATQLFQHGNDWIKLEYARFDPSQHRLGHPINGDGIFTHIDGSFAWGFDGISTEEWQRMQHDPDHISNIITAITLHHQGKISTFPAAAIENLFNFHASGAAIGNDGRWYLYGGGGDGAGSYYSVWHIHQGRLISQFIWFY